MIAWLAGEHWRSVNPHITWLWWDVGEAVMIAVRDKSSAYARGIRFHVQFGMLFIRLPSGRDLCYAKSRIGENQFGFPAATYMSAGATRKWKRIKFYGLKFVWGISRVHFHEGHRPPENAGTNHESSGGTFEHAGTEAL